MQPPRILLIAYALAMSACAHGRAHRPGDERLVGVDFEGNQQLSDKKLLTGLGLHRVLDRGGAPDPYTVQVDGDRIRGEYLRKGFLDVGVTSRVERKGDDTKVIYTVEEGQRAVTRAVITGLPDDVPVQKIREALPLRDGAPFDYEPYDLAKPQLLAVVQDAGYAHAKLDASIVADRATHTAFVELQYQPGPKCKFGKVEVAGVKGELARAVIERLEFAQGQTYSAQAVLQTQRNLYGFGRFSTVRVTPAPGDSEVVDIEVAVSESARHEVQLGAGFGIDPVSYEVRGRSGYTVAGWPFPLDTVTLDFRPAYAFLRDGSGAEPRIRALAKLERKDLFWTYTKASVEVGYNYLTIEPYTMYGPLARLGFETPIVRDYVSVRVGWAIEHTGFRKISPLLSPELQHDIGLDHIELAAGYQQKLIVDLRDHPIEPTLGAYGEVAMTEGGKFAGGDYQYFAVVPDVRGYVPLFGGAVLAAHARFGGIFGDVPPTERFFSGGAISQRGFAERRLSPSITGKLDPEDDSDTTVPYGGAGMLDTSIEARIPLTTVKEMPLGMAAFLDGGDVTEKPADLDVMNLHWAVGLGLRLQTIVGPVRLDVAYRLNRTGPMEPAPGSHFAYHLTIGEAF